MAFKCQKHRLISLVFQQIFPLCLWLSAPPSLPLSAAALLFFCQLGAALPLSLSLCLETTSKKVWLKSLASVIIISFFNSQIVPIISKSQCRITQIKQCILAQLAKKRQKAHSNLKLWGTIDPNSQNIDSMRVIYSSDIRGVHTAHLCETEYTHTGRQTAWIHRRTHDWGGHPLS